MRRMYDGVPLRRGLREADRGNTRADRTQLSAVAFGTVLPTDAPAYCEQSVAARGDAAAGAGVSEIGTANTGAQNGTAQFTSEAVSVGRGIASADHEQWDTAPGDSCAGRAAAASQIGR